MLCIIWLFHHPRKTIITLPCTEKQFFWFSGTWHSEHFSNYEWRCLRNSLKPVFITSKELLHTQSDSKSSHFMHSQIVYSLFGWGALFISLPLCQWWVFHPFSRYTLGENSLVCTLLCKRWNNNCNYKHSKKIGRVREKGVVEDMLGMSWALLKIHIGIEVFFWDEMKRLSLLPGLLCSVEA